MILSRPVTVPLQFLMQLLDRYHFWTNVTQVALRYGLSPKVTKRYKRHQTLQALPTAT